MGLLWEKEHDLVHPPCLVSSIRSGVVVAVSYARKVDTAQEAIVAGLRKMGVKVFLIGRPVDALLLFWSRKYQAFLWTPMEFKTPTKTGKRPSADKRQQEQNEFLELTGVPVVLSLDDAIAALEAL